MMTRRGAWGLGRHDESRPFSDRDGRGNCRGQPLEATRERPADGQEPKPMDDGEREGFV